MFPVKPIRVKRTYVEKIARKTDFIAKQRVRDKHLRIDRKLKELWALS